MTKDSSMITRDAMGAFTGISINGINFSTKEAFVSYRENHQFKVGDAVQALVKDYSGTKVFPAFICGINDFGGNRVAIDVVWIDGYDSLKFGSVYSDEIDSDRKSDGVVGLAPLNEFNDVGMRVSSVLNALNNSVISKETELNKLRNQLEMVKKFAENLKD